MRCTERRSLLVKMASKKGLSQVVSTVVLIALTVALVGGVFALVKSYVTDGLSDASACNDIIEKITLNSEYTCFDSTTNSTLISISRSEFDLESLLVSVSYQDSGRTFYLTETNGTIENLTVYKGGSTVLLPKNESGKTYCLSGTYPAPSLIQIAPKRSGKQCDVVDLVQEVPTCDQSINCQ